MSAFIPHPLGVNISHSRRVITAKSSATPPVSPRPLPSKSAKRQVRSRKQSSQQTTQRHQSRRTEQHNPNHLLDLTRPVQHNGFAPTLSMTNSSSAPTKRRRRSTSSSTSAYKSLSYEDAVHMATISYAKFCSSKKNITPTANPISKSKANKSKPTNKNNNNATRNNNDNVNSVLIPPSTQLEPLLSLTTSISTSSNTSSSFSPPSSSSTSQLQTVPSKDDVIHARNQITVKWLWLVSAIARNLYHSYTQSFPEMRAALSPSDLVQEGVCGLMQAVEKWDASRGYPFDAFAFYTVKHAVIRAVQNQSRPIRLPVHVLDKLAKMRKVREVLELHNRPVSVDAIARGAGVSRKSAELYLSRNKSTVSIDAPVMPSSSSASTPSPNSQTHHSMTNPSSSQNSAASLRDFLVDHSVDVAREVERSCTREAVAKLVNSTDLLELERSVLFLKFGLGDGVERVRAEVSRILDVRVHNVRRAELSALKKLRESVGNNISDWTELIS